MLAAAAAAAARIRRLRRMTHGCQLIYVEYVDNERTVNSAEAVCMCIDHNGDFDELCWRGTQIIIAMFINPLESVVTRAIIIIPSEQFLMRMLSHKLLVVA